ncbi:MAG: 2-phospho-L-lactate transferase [Actinomycetota bacterium]|nr:2-phospho-L-lactate transferase [Actinomycetota bacterium]
MGAVIVVLAGGVGGARFLRGLLAAVAADTEVVVIGNTGDDITLFGLRVCPDLDTVLYTLGGGISETQGWGRTDDTYAVMSELAAYGAEPAWFGLGDKDFATHILRTQMLAAGATLTEVTEVLCRRWEPGVRLLPMTDSPVETHVEIDDGAGGTRLVHFQEWWVGMHAAVPALRVAALGVERARPAPGVLEAIATADVVLLPPSNPVVSIGTILAVPGIREAVAGTPAPVVGLSPIISGAPVRGMADKVLAAIGVATDAAAVAAHYGARPAGLLDGWLVDSEDKERVGEVEAAGIACRAVPLLMRDLEASAEMARAALAIADEVRR